MWMYDYWLQWRKAYHNAREFYHHSFRTFYEEEIKKQDELAKLMVETYKTFSNMSILKDMGMYWVKPSEMFRGK